MLRNFGFSDSESGVGGMAIVVPMARSGVGGSEGRRERMFDELEDPVAGKTY
jgi:hypothetical protein